MGVGIDPGLVSIFTYSTEDVLAGEYSSRERRNQSGELIVARNAVAWDAHDGLNDYDQVRSTFPSKVGTVEAYHEYLIREHEFCPVTPQEPPPNYPNTFGKRGNFHKCSIKGRCKLKYAKSRKWSRIRGNRHDQRCLMKILKRVKEQQLKVTNVTPTLRVYYGGANIRSSMRGIRGGGVPTKAMRRKFKENFDCAIVNEFYTAQICHACQHRLYKCMNKSWKEDGRYQEIRGVRYCGHCNKLVHRDVNSAKCMVLKGKYAEANNGANHPSFQRQDGLQQSLQMIHYPNTDREKNKRDGDDGADDDENIF